MVNNTGVIEANSMDELFGKVELFAYGGTAQVDGTIKAKGGFVETSGKNLNVESTAKIETSKWLLDPVNLTIESSGGAIGNDSVSATAIQNALGSADIELQATNNIAVNENITWSTDKQLKLSADSIHVNAIIENTNTTNGGVFFNAANTNNKVIFNATDGKVIIHNANQLQWMNTALNGKYELGSNIDVSATSGWNVVSGVAKGWKPIGDITNGFSGKFDGLGHTISNLFINRPSEDYIGLFGYTDGANIKNINLSSVNITAKLYVGGLVGNSAASAIQNASTSGAITSSDNNAGGLVGSASSSTISNSYSSVRVIGMQNNVGGLVGYLFSSSISNSYATGAVTGLEVIGGLVGASWNSSTIKNSYATGGVTGTVTAAGGLLGVNYSTSRVENSYATGAVSGREYVGGLVGESDYSGTITNSYASNTVAGTFNVGGLSGAGGTIDSYYDNQANTGVMRDSATLGKSKADIVTLIGGTGTGAIWGTDGSSVEGYADVTLPFLKNVTKFGNTLFQSGFGDSTNPYTITNWTQLQNINYNSNVLTSNYFFSLSNNLISTTAGYTNTGTGWNPIGNNTDKFKGTFDGTNHTISNLFINRASQDNIGLFGYTNGATIKNLGLVDVDIKGRDYVGGLVGYNNTTSSITNSYASGTVSGGLLVGGLVGQNSNNSSITNSYASGTVNAISANLVGGLVGFNNNSTIINSYASGTVIVAGSAGGLVGQNISSSITNSFYDKEANTATMVDSATYGKTKAEIITAFSSIVSSPWTTAGSGASVAGYELLLLPYLTGVTRVADISKGTLFQSGFGNILNPYTITNWTQLQNINNSNILTQSKYFTLSNNLSSSTSDYTGLASTTANSNTGWNPIGNNNATGSTSTRFTGTFDGLGNTISDLNINRNVYYIGLFGHTDGANIKNIGVLDATITGSAYVAGLVGYNLNSSISNVFVKGNIVINYNIGGGIVGENAGTSTITDSYSTAKVTGGSAGGLIGLQRDTSTISNSFWDIEKTIAGIATQNSSGTSTIAGKTTKELSYGKTYTNWEIVADNTVTSATPVLKYDSVNSKYFWAIAPLDLTYTLGEKTSTYNGQTLSSLYTNVFGTDYSFITSGYKFKIGTEDVTGYKNAGTYDGIKVVSDGTNDFLTIKTAGSTDGKYVINKKALTISGTTSSDKEYNGDTVATVATAGTLSGFVTGETVSASAVGTFNDKDAGARTATFAYTLADGTNGLAANYSLANTTANANITKKALTMTGTTTADKTYDGTTTATTNLGTLNGFVTGETVTANASGTFNDKDAGARTATFAYTLADGVNGLAANYSLANTTANANITKKALTMTGTTTSDKTYDGTTTATTNLGTLSGFVTGETVTANASGTFNDKNVGTRTATFAYTLADGTNGLAANYSLANTTASGTITKADAIVTANIASKVYNGVSQNVNGFTASGLVNGETVSVLTGVSGDSVNGINVGTYTTALAGTDGNYNLSFVNGNLTITKANATVTANTASKVYNGVSQNVNGFTASGLVGSDTVSVLTGVSGDSVNGINVGTYTTALAGTDGNYNLSFVNGNLTITPKALIITGITAANKIYDGNANATVNTSNTNYAGLVGSENLTVNSTGVFDNKDVGINKTVNLSNTYAAVAGTDLNNYAITDQTTTRANITAVPTPDPIVPTPEPKTEPKVPENIIRAAENSVTPPIVRLPNTNVPLASTSNLATGNTGLGSNVNVVSQPTSSQSSQSVSLGQLQQSQTNESGSQSSGDIRVPASANSQIILVNGGVNLPDGVEQEFYVSANQNNENNTNNESKEK